MRRSERAEPRGLSLNGRRQGLGLGYDQRGELRHFRLDEDIEAKLLEACALLDRTQAPNKRKLTQEKAEAIRERAAAGTPQKELASEYKVSPAVACQIVGGAIWNPMRRKKTTRGSEMRRRLEARDGLGTAGRRNAADAAPACGLEASPPAR
jgi:hypothetical protein